jgi:hypothetical protein
MSHPKTIVSMRHMLDYAMEAVAMAKGKSRDNLDKERQLNLALVRLLEIVGEAANRIPKRSKPSIQTSLGGRSSAFATGSSMLMTWLTLMSFGKSLLMTYLN